jgi:glycosyltransferase involved in cell wall biosynthesis
MSTGSPETHRAPEVAGYPRVVLHVVDGLGLSGKTRNLVSVVSQLDRRRFAPVVCRLNAEWSPLVRQLEAAQIPLHTIACTDGLNPGAALRLARLAWSVRADIVHCYNPRPMLYGGLAARAIGIRATVGFLSAFACQVPDRTYGFLPQPLTTLSRRNVYRNRLAAASMRFIVAVSPSLGRRFCQYNDVPLDKLRVIPYGTDLKAVDRVTPERASELRQQLGFRPDDVVIGSVGRLVEQKDYPTQLRAFALAVARVPSLRMVIAGDGPLRSKLEHMARELAVAHHVRFLGNWNDVPALLRSVDVFAMASKFEPFGVALVEAKAAGLPIVATAVNEIPEIIADGESGLLAPPEDAPRMAALFIKLAQDRERRHCFGARARREAQQRSLQAAVAAYESLYDESLDQRSHGFFARSAHA